MKAREGQCVDPFDRRQVAGWWPGYGSPLLIVDCERMRAQYRSLRRRCPASDLHYALKPLPHPAVVAPRCARSGQASTSRPPAKCSWSSRLGVDRRALHPHASDQARQGHPQCAAARRQACSSPTTRTKCASSRRYRGQAELLLRVSFRSPGAVSDLSRKFGCDPETALDAGAAGAQARHRACRGSRSTSARRPPTRSSTSRRSRPAAAACSHGAAREAWRRSKCSTSAAASRSTTASACRTIGRFCAPIRKALAALPKRVRVIAEPGRFIAGPAAIGVASRDGPRRARGPLVVLPRRRRCTAPTAGSSTTTRSYPIESLEQGGERGLRCWRARPATAST